MPEIVPNSLKGRLHAWKGFISACAIATGDFGWIPKGPKSADFDQEAWAISHGFDDGGLWQVPEIVPNSLKHRQNACKQIFNSYGIIR